MIWKRSIVNSGQRQRRRHATQWLAIAAVGLAVVAYAAPSLPADWDQIVAAAKRERQVVVIGPPGADNRDALVLGFKKRYPDIAVNFTGGHGTPNASKLLIERRAGLRFADLYLGPTFPVFRTLLPANAVQPIQPFLVGPNIEPSKWLGGKFEFTDAAGKYQLMFFTGAVVPFAYNPSLVPADELKTYKDLLKPKWKGKIVIFDPRRPSTAQGIVLFWYLTKNLGKPFIRQFLTQQNVVLSRNSGQMVDWVVRGKYPIAVGASSTLATQKKRKGLPVELFDPSLLREGTWLAGGAAGGASAVEGAPHPNATKVYLNWLLSKEGQTIYGRASGNASRRTDVPNDYLDRAVILQPGGKYLESYRERYVPLLLEMLEFLKTVLP